MKVGCLFQAFCQTPLSLSTQVKMKVAIGPPFNHGNLLLPETLVCYIVRLLILDC